jgi:hypothetical protein
METKTKTPLESIQAARFDECVAELSPEAQDYFKFAVKRIADGLAAGGGVISAKALLYALAYSGKNYFGGTS